MRMSVKSSLKGLLTAAAVAFVATGGATPGLARGGGGFHVGGGFHGGGGFRGGGFREGGGREFGGGFRGERRLRGYGFDYGGYDAYNCNPYSVSVNPWACGY
jgi:hypothetical protein